MNRQERRTMGSKMSKKDMGALTQNFEQQINQIRNQVATADRDVDTLMTIEMSNKLSADQTIEKSDIVAVGFMGRLHKEDGTLEELPFQGGVAPYQLLTRFNTGEFIPGFEEQMEGMKPGDKRTIEVQFPKNYHAQLAEKKAKFEVVVIAAWRLNKDMSYVDEMVQELFKAKMAKDREATKVEETAPETQPSV